MYNISRRGGISGVHNIRKNTVKSNVGGFSTFFAFFNFFIASRRPRRPPETFLEPVAPFSQSMGPYRATTPPFIPKSMLLRVLVTSVTDTFSSNGPFHYGSISPSTVPLNFGTPLDLCARPWCVDIPLREIKRIRESRVIQLSVGKHIKTAKFRVGHFPNFL